MTRPQPFAYTPDQSLRIQLGLTATRPDSDPTLLRVAITANLVATNAKPLKTIILDAIADGRVHVVLDLNACPDADKRGLETLLSAQSATRRAGGSLVLLNTQPDFLELLRAHGISNLFTFEPETTP